VLPGDIEEYGVLGNILIFFLFAYYDKKKKGKKLNRRPRGEKGNLSNCQSLVNGKLSRLQGRPLFNALLSAFPALVKFPDVTIQTYTFHCNRH
jgi:hypothetical protein